MKIVCIGGGPGGLYFSILMKKAFPSSQIQVFERNRADDTFGWGVVFSDETLSNFEKSDPESFAQIRQNFVYWDRIETFYREQRVASTGHGFCGLSRKRLLEILQERCRALGVSLQFQKEITDFSSLDSADLIVACDGANSLLREKKANLFRPQIQWGRCKFSWLGTDKELTAFTFLFRESEFGLFQVHAYPFEKGKSTFIVECREEVWKKAGLDRASEAETVAFCEKLFAKDLQGHRLLSNRSIWRSFPTVSNERWHDGKTVLLGDSAHTAHFSIGSGTKLAMEDAMALAEAFQKTGTQDISSVLTAYESVRKPETIRTQRAAQTSQAWFENSARYLTQEPLPLVFNLMTRSKRITYDNLRSRDPQLIQKVNEGWKSVAPIFTPFRLRGLELANRIVVSPMCQYSAVNGKPTDWHLVHLGSRAVGGAGIVFTEMTNVSPEGRITHGCAGIYQEEHVEAWKRIIDFVHSNSKSKIGMQIAHAGRKGSCNLPWEGDHPLSGTKAWQTLAPSAEPFARNWPAPKEMTRTELDQVREEFVKATRNAEKAGFDLIELHMAHGYLLSSFLSPKSNFRCDEYGGTLENRMRYPLEVFDAVRKVWPKEKPIFVRISASDWLDQDGGQTIEESVVIAKALKEHGCDLIDVSSAGNTPESKPVYGRMYQVPFAEQIRYEAEIPVMAVGGIQNADHANTILAAERADLCALARPHLLDPYLSMHAAVSYGSEENAWPSQYLAVRPRKTGL